MHTMKHLYRKIKNKNKPITSHTRTYQRLENLISDINNNNEDMMTDERDNSLICKKIINSHKVNVQFQMISSITHFVYYIQHNRFKIYYIGVYKHYQQLQIQVLNLLKKIQIGMTVIINVYIIH